MGRPPVLSGFICYHCGSDQTCKGGWSKGKRRFKCRGCGKFFIEGGGYRPPGKYKPGENTPSAEYLILELQTIAQRIGRTPTTTIITELAREGDAHHVHHYYAVFGSFLNALKRAHLRLHYMQEFDPADRLIMLNQLRTLSIKLGRPLFAEDVTEAGKRGEVSTLNHFSIAFGTIPSAIELAGVAPKREYTREELIEHLREVAATSERPVTGEDLDKLYDKGKGPSHRQYDRMFGSMVKAREAAGVKNEYLTAVRKDKYWTRYTVEEIIAQLQTLGKQLGRKPTDRDINGASGDYTFASAETVSRMFGNLKKAYLAAGFDLKRRPQYSDDEIIAALKRLTNELGRFPTYDDVCSASKAGKCPGVNTIRTRLGNLSEIRSQFE